MPTPVSRHLRLLMVMLTLSVGATLMALLPATPPVARAAGVVGSGSPASCTAGAFATALEGGGSITFNCGPAPHSITLLETSIIAAGESVRIDGGGLITISGGNAVRVFQVERGALTLENLTIADGNMEGERGGGIASFGGSVVLNNSTVKKSQALYGGGIAIRDSASLMLTNSTITGNSATEYGGGVHIRESSAEIRNSTISGNRSETEHGGGLFFTSSGTVVIESSTISSNSAASLGGGIFAGGGDVPLSLTITNSTITGNQAEQGGALHASATEAVITSSTIANNTITASFAGVEIRGNSSSLTLRNTILANPPEEGVEWDDPNCAVRDGAELTSAGGNIQFPRASCGSDIPTTDPLLVPLADNGGATQTMTPGANSPAIDGGVAEGCPPTDQRGSPRPADGDGDGTPMCDSGAYEVQADETPPSGDNVVGTGVPASCTEAALREAVLRGGTITFDCGAAPYTITVSDDVIISDDTIIDGGGTAQGGLITISGGNATRVFFVNNGVDLTVKNLTIADGREPGDDSAGGGIYGNDRNNLSVSNAILENHDGTAGTVERSGGAMFTGNFSTVVISDTLFRNNRGINGGAINNLLSTLTIVNSTFEGNEAVGANRADIPEDRRHGGGAIYTDGASEFHEDSERGGRITIRGSTFRNNSAYGQGGAIFTWVYPTDDVVVEDTLFVGNTVLSNLEGRAALGGGMYHGNGPLTMDNTIFLNNTAQRQGGGLWPDGRYAATLTNVSFIGNRAVNDEGSGEGGLGGALAGKGNTTCINCTIAGNHAGNKGGGIFFNQADNEGRQITLVNTIIYSNTAFNDGAGSTTFQQCADDPLTDGGGNLQFPPRNPDADNDIDCLEGITIADPLLNLPATLDDPQQAITLPAGSPAIDAANDARCPATDQRGAARPVDGDEDGSAQCDSGAYEYGADVAEEPAPAPEPQPDPSPEPEPDPTPDPVPDDPGSGSTPLYLPLVRG